MIDITGKNLSVPISPMDICEWEEIQIDAEAVLMGAIPDDAKEERQLRELLALGILKMSKEIHRLRLTYGEEVWAAVYHSDEEDAEIRSVHEAQRKTKT